MYSFETKSQVIYTPKDEIINDGSVMFIDMNNDIINEFRIDCHELMWFGDWYGSCYDPYYEEYWVIGFDDYFSIISIFKENTNCGIGFTYYDYTAEKFQINEIISYSTSYTLEIDLALNYHYTRIGEECEGYYNYDYGGQFGIGYIGIYFMIGENIHYGWIEIRVDEIPYSAFVVGYAYELQPSVSIIAGDTVGVYLIVPETVTIEQNSAIVDFLPSKTGTLFYIVQNATEAAPTKYEIKDGTSASGGTLIASGFAIATENMLGTIEINELYQDTQYTLYSVLESATIISNVKSTSLVANIVEIEESNATSVFLSKPFPNPFTDKTTIRYMLPQSAQVNLTIYNAIGQHLYSVSQEHTQAGQYTLTLDRNNLAKGLYYYNVEVLSGENRIMKAGKLIIN